MMAGFVIVEIETDNTVCFNFLKSPLLFSFISPRKNDQIGTDKFSKCS